jgi:hypothetical protein
VLKQVLAQHNIPQDLVRAHMWFSLAAAQGDKSAINQDTVARRMTPAQIAEAQKLAREWKPKPERQILCSAGARLWPRVKLIAIPEPPDTAFRLTQC